MKIIMTVPDQVMQADEGVSIALFYKLPLNLSQVKTSIEELWRDLFQFVGDRLLQEKFGEEERIFADTWFYRLKWDWYGAKLCQRCAARNYANFRQIDVRLKEVELTGSIIGRLLEHASYMSRAWPEADSLKWSRIQRRAVQNGLQDVEWARRACSNEILSQSDLKPVLPTADDVEGLLREHKYNIAPIGRTFIDRALSNLSARGFSAARPSSV